MSKVKITKNELVNMFGGLNDILANHKENATFKFNYALKRNLQKLKDDVKAIDDVKKTKLSECSEEMTVLQEKYKKENMKNPAMQERANKELEEINKKYEPVLKEYNDFMAEEIEIDLYLVKEEFVPDLRPKQYNAIFSMFIVEEK